MEIMSGGGLSDEGGALPVPGATVEDIYQAIKYVPGVEADTHRVVGREDRIYAG